MSSAFTSIVLRTFLMFWSSHWKASQDMDWSSEATPLTFTETFRNSFSVKPKCFTETLFRKVSENPKENIVDRYFVLFHPTWMVDCRKYSLRQNYYFSTELLVQFYLNYLSKSCILFLAAMIIFQNNFNTLQLYRQAHWETWESNSEFALKSEVYQMRM